MNSKIRPADWTFAAGRSVTWRRPERRRRRPSDLCWSVVETEAGGATPRQMTEAEEDPIVGRQRVEAVLILAKTPLSARKVAQLAGLADATEARTLIRRLNEIYDEMGRAFRAEEVAGGYQLLTRASLAPWLRRLGHVPPEIRFSPPAMETLAIVAYRHPVLRADIEAIRGVACGDLLRQLMDRDLVRICGRSEELGRPYLYGTTKRFLQVFGLRSTDALPKADFSFETLPTDLDENVDHDDSPPSPLDSGDSEQEPDVTTALAPLDANTDADLQAEQAIPVARAEGAPTSINEVTSALDDDEDDWEDEELDDDEDDLVDDDDDADVEADDIDDEDEEDDWDDDWDDEDDDDLDEDDEELDEDDELDEWEEVGDEDDELDEDLDDDDDDEDEDDEEWD